jgi:hypothetical protein
MFAGWMVATAGVLLVSDKNTPPAGAGVVNVTRNCLVSPGASVTVGRTISCGICIVTFAVAAWTLAAEAVIVTWPALTPLTGTDTVLVFAARKTVGGTVAIPVLLEARLIVIPAAGAGETVSVRAPFLVIETVAGVKENEVPVTDTCPVAAVHDGADAVIVAEPGLTPTITGCVTGVVWPCGITTVAGTVTIDGSLLTRDTVTGPETMAFDKTTGNATDWLTWSDVAGGTDKAP